ncbi:hypothetical protein [Kordiimonas aquimaris]|uniref:hypothetical protein n=1 Tax=Kordiimonas aquimaris TaxID=707591 RepID=UPI0021CF7882|nr:hypothetical protein [Kordiimonas aquimaris]
MTHKLRNVFFFLTCSVLFLPTISANANENKLLLIARESAIVAGGAKYCKLDDDLVEEFIARVEARLSVLASDEYEKVLARLEFKNVLDAYSVRAPEKPCPEFTLTFERARQSLQ